MATSTTARRLVQPVPSRAQIRSRDLRSAPAPKKRRAARVKHTAAPVRTLLPPENPIDVAEPGSSGETVHQRRLRELYELEKQYVDIRARYLAAYARVEHMIQKGAAIQAGDYNKVSCGVRLVRRPKYKQVVIDLKGEDYQRRVLESTQPHARFRVRIE